MKKRVAVPEREYALGTVFNPHVVGEDYMVRFEYEKNNVFEVRLEKDGTLLIRMSGSHSDLIATHHHVANSVIMVARRYDYDAQRHVDLIKTPIAL